MCFYAIDFDAGIILFLIANAQLQDKAIAQVRRVFLSEDATHKDTQKTTQWANVSLKLRKNRQDNFDAQAEHQIHLPKQTPAFHYLINHNFIIA